MATESSESPLAADAPVAKAIARPTVAILDAVADWPSMLLVGHEQYMGAATRTALATSITRQLEDHASVINNL